MLGKKQVTVDFLPDSPLRHLEHDAVICIDVIRATTTLVTAVVQGRRAFPAASVAEARELAASLKDPLLAGEVRGGKPEDFEIGNSPALVAERDDVRRPLVLVSLSGTPLVTNAAGCRAAYVACFRNLAATAEWVAARHQRVAILGAGSHGELRCEDQMAVSWMAERLMALGHEPENIRTSELVRRWSGTSVQLAAWGNSAEYLRRTGQERDLQFVLEHQDDAAVVCRLEDGEIRRAQAVPVAVRKVQAPVRLKPALADPATFGAPIPLTPRPAQGAQR